MTKTKFLKELEKSLYVLAEVERKDIIDEYRDIIEEKVKHGKTEKEAVEEFGSIEELSREILSAYKVNPDYGKKEDDLTESAKKLGNDFDSFVKKGAKKATEFSKELVEEIRENNDEITIEFVFELLFKGIATLIIMFIASLPFMLVRQIGANILDIMIYPLNHILVFVWSLFIAVLFIGCCFLIFIAMFKQYFNKVKKKDGVTEKTDSAKKEKTVDKKENVVSTHPKKEKANDVKAEPVKVVKPKREKHGTPLLDIFLAIAKALMVVMLIPLIMFNVAIFVSVIVIIYLMVKGLMIPGALIGGVGLLLFFGYLQNMLFNVIFRHKKIHFYPFAIGIALCVVGGILCFDQAINMNYYDQAPANNFEVTKTTKKVMITQNKASLELYDYNKVTYQVDETLPDNEVVFTLQYKKDLLNINVHTYTHNYYDHSENTKYDADGNPIMDYETQDIISVGTYQNNFLNSNNRKIRKLIIDNFKNNSIYNYDKLYNADITISTNSNTKAKLVNLEEILHDAKELGN